MNPRKLDLRRNLERALPVAVLVALGTTACSDAEGAPNREGTPNPNITSITVQDGARIREKPIVPGQYEGDDTLLAEVDQGDVIETPGGVKTYEDNNGEWYTIPAKEAAELVTDEEDKEAILAVEGDVWVNDDRAVPQYDKDN
jgi:hypothetical protein